MSIREDNEDVETVDHVWEEETHQDDKVEEQGCPDEKQHSNVVNGSPTVISKGKARLIISGAEEAEPDKPRAIAPKPRVVSARPQEPVPEASTEETVERLERVVNPGKERIKVNQAKFEELKERPDEAERQEEEWGKGIISGWWIAVAGVCAAVLLLGSLAIKNWFDGDEAQDVVLAPSTSVNDDLHAGSPEKWFHDRAGKIGKEANAVLSAFMSAPDDVSRSKWVRQPDVYLKRVKLGQVTINPRLDQEGEQSWRVGHTENTAFLILDCRDTDFMPFHAYFTRDGEQLKLDWQATTAWSEVPLQMMKKDLQQQQIHIDKLMRDAREAQELFDSSKAARGKSNLIIHVVSGGESMGIIARRYKTTVAELMKVNQLPDDMLEIGQKLKIASQVKLVDVPVIVVPLKPEPVKPPALPLSLYTEPVLVRCMIRRKDEFYAGPYNDREHSAFMLSSADNAHYLWAYTARDSPLDLELRRLLDHGRFVVALKKDVRVTVRIRRNQKDALPSQLELVEIVHPEWVTP
jgi:hypothetical protein